MKATKTWCGAKRTRFRPENGYKMPTMAEPVTTKDGTFEIRSESHGPHWVAWLARTSDGAPEQSVLLVGQTQAEAEARARLWAERR
jgi:hypothetical protein